MQSTVYWEKKDIARKVHNESFIVQKNHKANNAKRMRFSVLVYKELKKKIKTSSY